MIKQKMNKKEKIKRIKKIRERRKKDEEEYRKGEQKKEQELKKLIVKFCIKSTNDIKDGDLKRLLDLDDHNFFVIIRTFKGNIVDVFCTPFPKIADAMYLKLKKESKYNVEYKKCDYNDWRIKLFGAPWKE